MRGPLLLVDVDAIIEQQQSSPQLDLEIGPPIYDLNDGIDELPAAHFRQSAEPKQAEGESAAAGARSAAGSERAWKPEAAGKEAGLAYAKDSLTAAVGLRNGAHADSQVGSSNGSAEGMESNEQRSSNGSRWSQREDVGRAGAAGQSKSAAEDQCAHRRGGTM